MERFILSSFKSSSDVIFGLHVLIINFYSESWPLCPHLMSFNFNFLPHLLPLPWSGPAALAPASGKGSTMRGRQQWTARWPRAGSPEEDRMGIGTNIGTMGRCHRHCPEGGCDRTPRIVITQEGHPWEAATAVGSKCGACATCRPTVNG
jgi:hypothetical protein